MTKEKLKSKVLRAAWALVEKGGMAQLNVRKITKQSQCSLGSFYNAFDNFEDLQLHINSAVLATLFLELQMAIERGIAKNKPYTEIMKDLGLTYIKFGEENIQLWKSVFEHFNTESIPQWYRDRAQEGVNKLCEILSSHFELPLEKVQHQVGFFWAAIHGMSAIMLNKKMAMVTELFKEASIDMYIDYCLNGLY